MMGTTCSANAMIITLPIALIAFEVELKMVEGLTGYGLLSTSVPSSASKVGGVLMMLTS